MAIKAVLKRVLSPPLAAIQRRRRQSELRRRSEAITGDRLSADLAKLPIADQSVVLVHSSLKSIGFVEGGANAVVAALIDDVVRRRGGTVMFPTFSIDGTMEATLRARRRFDVRHTPSNLGVLPEAFRVTAGVVRSVHPTHSFAAIGPKAAWLVEEHHRCGTNFGEGSPMAKLLQTQSYLLGLGTDVGKVTFYHCLEDIEAFPFNVYSPDSPFEVECVDGDGSVHVLRLPAHDADVSANRIDRPNSTALRAYYSKWLAHEAGLSWHQVGAARTWLVDCGSAYVASKRLADLGLTIYADAAAVAAFAAARPLDD